MDNTDINAVLQLGKVPQMGLMKMLVESNDGFVAYYDSQGHLVDCVLDEKLNYLKSSLPQCLDPGWLVDVDALPRSVSIDSMEGNTCILSPHSDEATPYILFILSEFKSLIKIIHDLPVGVIYINKHWDAVFVNAKCAELIKSDIESMLGRQWTRYLPPELEREFHQHVSDPRVCREPLRKQIEYISPLGKSYTFLVQLVAYFDHRNEFISASITVNDITKESHAVMKLQYTAEHDQLTDLYNRAAFIAKAEALEATEFNNALFLFIDLDRFKEINDTLGHKFGDRVLKIVARRINSTIRDDDLCARFGGDEFVICMPNISCDDVVKQIATKISNALNCSATIEGKDVYVRASVGVVWTPTIVFDEGTPRNDKVQALIDAADQGMYEAKRGYLNNESFKIYDINLRQQRLLVQNQKDELCQAIDNEGLACHFQPIFNKAGYIESLEALARFNEPLQYFNGIEDVIVFAKRLGIEGAFFKSALTKAIEGFSRLRCYNPSLMLNLNVDVSQLETPMFVAEIKALCSNNSIPFTQVRIEITEVMLERNSSRLDAHIKQLIQLGFSISMDDFGTGYSSFKRLLNYEFHELKIDRYFVDSLVKSKKFEKMFKAMVAVGKSFNLQILAEGIETEEQYEKCRELGVELFQGYFLAKPMSIADLEKSTLFYRTATSIMIKST